MRKATAFLFLILICMSILAVENANDFHSAKTLYARATISSHNENFSKSSSFDPRIGIAFSFPFYFNFIHIDLSSEISPRPFLAHDYNRTYISYSSNHQDTFSRTTWVWDQKGIETVLSIYPTLYFRHFFIGFGDILDIEFILNKERYILLDPVQQDTVYKSKDQKSGDLSFENFNPGLKLGWRFSTCMLSVFFEPKGYGLSYHQKIANWPSKNKKLRTSIFDDTYR